MVARILGAMVLAGLLFFCKAQPPKKKVNTQRQTRANIAVGADRLDAYLPLLKGKRVGIFANQTSMVGKLHLVDLLQQKGVRVAKIFSPEHGFRGNADAGEKVGNSKDEATGIEIISLYGDHKKPTAAELQGLDVLVFDIQDVGVRFYTYITSLQIFMEAALEADLPLLILDRPNPNGFYVDGPVLQKAFNSFIGMQPIPIVYGMTMGEYAMMLAGEKWLTEAANQKYASIKNAKPTRDTPFHLMVIKCSNYQHNSYYAPPVKPSPNLPNMQSILLYPSICFFEGTNMSLGRGTDKPFQLFGSPVLPDTLFSFTPVSTAGAKEPPLKNQLCYGYDLSAQPMDISKKNNKQINLSYLLHAYQQYPNKDSFFVRPKKNNPAAADYFFNKLAGNETLLWQILNDKTEAEIRASWQQDLDAFMAIRKKYLLYPDFK